MGVTIRDIAREAGLSPSAVSLVLNNKPCRLSEENKQRIREIAQRLGYTPNLAARSLVTRQSKMLALIVPDIENAFFASLAKRLEDSCRADDYVLLIANSNDHYAEDQRLVQTAVSRGADGVFLIPSNESYTDNSALVAQLGTLPVPYVLVDRSYDNLPCDKVSFHNERGAELATRHLLELGHRRIACVSNEGAANGRARLAGYKKAMAEYGAAIRKSYIQPGDYRYESGYAAAWQIVKTDATAAFIGNDMMALGFMKGLHEAGRRVPQDFSITSYDNVLAPYLLGAKLTSIGQDPGRLAVEAYRLMQRRLAGDNGGAVQCILEPELIVGESTQRAGEIE